MKYSRTYLRLLALLLAAVFALVGCGTVGDLVKPYESELGELGQALLDQLLEPSDSEPAISQTDVADEPAPTPEIDREGSYTARDEVALYLRTFGELPQNFITKEEARRLGWDNSRGNLHDVAPGKSIGGDRFGNYEGLLPQKDGRQYFECDIDYTGGYRNAKRIVYSNDGLIFYTDDHYESFTELT